MTSTSIIRDVAMKGAGYYFRATTGAKDVIDNATPMVLEAADALPIPEDGRPITVADMGCADGGTSMEMIGKVVQALRRRAPGHPIQMIYTDLPRNDFSQLFQNVHGLTDLESPLVDIPDVYCFASGTSFHKSIFPSESLHLGFSATASHYISEKPCTIPDHVHMVGASGAVREAYEAQGARDWEAMLLQRTRELVPGGHLALFNFGIDEEGRYLGHTGGVSMFDTYNELWRELADRGTITPDEYRNTNFAQCYRTVDQFCAPLIDMENPVYRAGLRLKHVETRVVRCPFETRLCRSRRRRSVCRRIHSDPAVVERAHLRRRPFARPARGRETGNRRSLLRQLRRPGPAKPRGPCHGLCPHLPGVRKVVTEGRFRVRSTGFHRRIGRSGAAPAYSII